MWPPPKSAGDLAAIALSIYALGGGLAMRNALFFGMGKGGRGNHPRQLDRGTPTVKSRLLHCNIKTTKKGDFHLKKKGWFRALADVYM